LIRAQQPQSERISCKGRNVRVKRHHRHHALQRRHLGDPLLHQPGGARRDAVEGRRRRRRQGVDGLDLGSAAAAATAVGAWEAHVALEPVLTAVWAVRLIRMG